MNKIVSYCIALVFLLAIEACRPSKHYTTKKSKTINYPENDLLEINAVAYHLNDSLTDITVNIKNENLLYKRTDTSISFFAQVRVFYALYEANDFKKYIDSSSFYLFDGEQSEVVDIKSLSNQFRIKAKYGNNYVLSIEAIDLNRKSRNTVRLNIQKENKLSIQNFKIKKQDGIAFHPVFNKNQLVQISTENESINKLFVSCFTKEIGAALPPFSTKQNEGNQLKADSSFIIERQHGQFVLNTPEQGFYFIKASEAIDVGFSLLVFENGFPGVNDVDDMIKCCRYIMYKEEFDTCKNAPDKKAAIDNFWLGIGGSHERAREILKKYYGRVKLANQNYSSYKEGWKTDRGMISIIFGAPSNVYKSKNDEIWIYGIETNPAALRFIFTKQESVLSDNEYVLERSGFYKEAFYQAVDYWRQGIVYSEKGLDR